MEGAFDVPELLSWGYVYLDSLYSVKQSREARGTSSRMLYATIFTDRVFPYGGQRYFSSTSSGFGILMLQYTAVLPWGNMSYFPNTWGRKVVIYCCPVLVTRLFLAAWSVPTTYRQYSCLVNFVLIWCLFSKRSPWFIGVMTALIVGSVGYVGLRLLGSFFIFVWRHGWYGWLQVCLHFEKVGICFCISFRCI